MNKIIIDAAVSDVVLEIDGREYPLARRTPETSRRLNRLEAECAGDCARYELELAQLAVLLGPEAVGELFPCARMDALTGGCGDNDGKELHGSLDLDRLTLIHRGTLRAYLRHADGGSDGVRAELARMNDLLEAVAALVQAETGADAEAISHA